MSLTRVGPENLEVTTLLLQPSQSFTTSSLGSSGSLRLISKPSAAVKGFTRSGEFGSAIFSETEGVTADDDILYRLITQPIGSNITSDLNDYLTSVKATSRDARQGVIFYPTSSFSPGTSGQPPTAPDYTPLNAEDRLQYEYFQRKVIKNCLIPDQIVQNPRSNYAYTNYHCLNFMSTSNTPTGSALIYPNLSNNYSLTSSFTINFYVKPKAQITADNPYHAGAIMHMTSSMCIALHSASIGPDGRADKFKLTFQTNSAANIAPHTLNLESPPAGVFVTNAVLKRDTWHRVTIRYAKTATGRSSSTGSISIDGEYDTPISFSSLNASNSSICKALFIGNFYKGLGNPNGFFNSTQAALNGTVSNGAGSDPSSFEFLAPLNAELHQVSLFNRYLNNSDIDDIATLTSVTSSIGDGPVFYLPVTFTGSTPSYTTYLTPAVMSNDAVTFDGPVNSSLALGYNTNFTNIQNFLVEEVTKNLPRAYGYHETSPSAVDSSYDLRSDDTDNVMLGLSTSNRKRSTLIFPCDNGNYLPKFLKSNTDNRFFYDDRSNYDETLISLNNLIPSSSVSPIVPAKFYTAMAYDGSAYTQTDETSKSYLPILQNRNATKDSRGNLAASSSPDLSLPATSIFSIPTPFYGTRIVPGTFTFSDSSISGSGGMRMTLQDDGIGNLYRSDTQTTPAKWNRVGTIFYDHGIVCILNPHLTHFGRSGYNMNFRGETRKVVASYTIIAGPGEFDLSKNPTYKSFPPTTLTSESADNFVYITGINLHDENLNVIMRAKLAQPIKKRDYDELAFRLRYDF